MTRAEAMQKLKRECAACAHPEDKYGQQLVLLEGENYEPIAYLCRGRNDQPKAACFSKYLMQREVACVVCGEELHSWKPAGRVRPVCKPCEAKIDGMKEREAGGRKWYAFDTYEVFGQPTPGNSHADYSALGVALLKALGAPSQTVSGAEWLLPASKRRGGDRYHSGSVELSAEQAEGLREFVAAFATYVGQVAEAQHRKGTSLLLQLASGEASINDFNEATINPKGERDR